MWGEEEREGGESGESLEVCYYGCIRGCSEGGGLDRLAGKCTSKCIC